MALMKNALGSILLRKSKSNKMARGGLVEKENVGRSDMHHFGHASDSLVENEPEQHDLRNRGFSKDEIDDHDGEYEYDVLPEGFAEGGMCYADGGVIQNDDELHNMNYPEHMEENMQIKHRMSGTENPALVQVEDHDKDRLSFVRKYLTHRMMRSRLQK